MRPQESCIWKKMVKAMKCVSSPLLFPNPVTSGLEPSCYFFFSKMLLSTHYVLASVQVFFPEMLLLNPPI